MTEGSDEVSPKEGVFNASNGTTHRLASKILTEDGATAKSNNKAETPFVPRIRWPDLIVQLFIHLGCLYGIFLMFTSAKLLTSLLGK